MLTFRPTEVVASALDYAVLPETGSQCMESGTAAHMRESALAQPVENGPCVSLRTTLAYADFASLCVLVLAFAHDALSRSSGHTRSASTMRLMAGILSGSHLCECEVPFVPVLILPAVCSAMIWLCLGASRAAFARALVIFPALTMWLLLSYGGASFFALLPVFLAFSLIARASTKQPSSTRPQRPSDGHRMERTYDLLLLSVALVLLPGVRGYLTALKVVVDAIFEAVDCGTVERLFRWSFVGRLDLVWALRGALLSAGLAFFLFVASVYLVSQTDYLASVRDGSLDLRYFLWPFRRRDGREPQRLSPAGH